MQRTRIAAGIGLVITCMALWTSVASAHVNVSGPYPVTKGGYTKLTFRVPNERADASTIKLRVQFPQDYAFRSVSNRPKAGWTFEPTMRKLDPPLTSESGAPVTEAVSEVTWTAEPGVKIGPHQFEEFELSVGPLPKDKAELAFPSIQTYDTPDKDGIANVEWIQKRKEGEKDPAKPEPVLKLADAAPAAGANTTSASVTATGSAGGEQAAGTAASDAQSSADSAKTMGTIGLVLGAIALLAAIAALARKPKEAADRI